MAAVADSGENRSPAPAADGNHEGSQAQTQTLGGAPTPWVEYALQRAQLAEKSFQDAVDRFARSSRSRLSEIRSTSSAHLQMTLESLRESKAEYHVYEDFVFGKIKEGITVAASNPVITSGIAFGVGFFGFKRPRRFLYHNMMRLLVSEESMISGADSKVKELRQTFELLKAESEKLEQKALHAEEEFKRGRKKLRHAGNQIQGVVRSAYKVERQAAGLKDILGELPRVEALRFRSQVSKLASEAKQERNILTKEVSKISNYGISV